MAKESFEQRLFRVFGKAGYSPVRILTLTPEEMVQVPDVTVPEIRTVLCVQKKILSEKNNARRGHLVAAVLQWAAKEGQEHGI